LREETSTYKIHQFDGPGVFRHLRQALEWDDPLSKNLRELPIEQGSVTSYLPSSFEIPDRDEFRYGQAYIIGEEVSQAFMFSVNFIHDYLKAVPNRVVMFPTIYHRGEKSAVELTVPYVYLSPDESLRQPVCCFIDHHTATLDTVERAMREARPFSFLGILTSLPGNSGSLRSAQELTAADAQALAIKTDHLIVGAFDDIGKLIWTRPTGEEQTVK
jgi:hypothetical protein